MSKGIRNALIILISVFAVIFAVVFFAVIMPLLPATKHRFKDYRTFRQKTNTLYLTDAMPDNAKPEYYFHSFIYKRQSGYKVTLPQDEYEALKEDAKTRYHNFADGRSSTILDDHSDSKTEPDYSKLKSEKLGFIEEEFIGGSSGFCIMYDMTVNDTNATYRAGMLCNDTTCEIIEFYSRIPIAG